MTHALRLSLSLAFLFVCASAAHANYQTYVSVGGDDANNCTRPAPCRTFAGAIPNTVNRGEVVVLDSGEYGHFTVTGSIKITAVGVYAGVTVFDADGVTVKPVAGSEIALRGLTISGWSSSRGIVYEGPTVAREGEPTATLHVENCTFAGLSIAGISFKGNGDLFVKDTTIRNVLGHGIEVAAAQGQKARANIVNTRLEKTHWGVSAHGTGSVNVSARDTVSNGNKNGGFLAYESSGVRMQLQDCVASNQSVGVRAYESARVMVEGCAMTNLTLGVFVNNLGDVRLSNTTITDCDIAIQNIMVNNVGAFGYVYTFNNNRLHGNTQNVGGKWPTDAQQF
ncbi:MAG TPA: right-handed parallel beta-helix repeat-containing protein [Pyrinomonadaceae bacterium]|nr:right-handed parallel beta-helix repeat-containing protein [Pyrinomonadaceae bacterium]